MKDQIFVSLQTATDTEMNMAMRIYPSFEKLALSNGGGIYYSAGFSRDGKRYQVLLSQQPDPGMTAAAAHTMKVINLFKPKYVILTGIAAGVMRKNEDGQLYGDIVVADVVWDYTSGKFVKAGDSSIKFGSVGFISRPRVIRTDKALLKYAEAAIKSPENQNHVHIGTMACGTSVVANKEVVEKRIHSQFKETAGLDMESYAVMYAAKHAVPPLMSRHKGHIRLCG